jgi:prolipoprotein diacylglyceryltransferase
MAVGYELLMDVVIFAGLVWLARGFVREANGRFRANWQPRLARDGMLFWAYLFVYSIGRFFIQFYRVDTPFALGLSQAQLLSVLTAMVAVWALAYQAQRAKKLGPSEPWAMRPKVSAPAEPEPEVPEHAPLAP